MSPSKCLHYTYVCVFSDLQQMSITTEHLAHVLISTSTQDEQQKLIHTFNHQPRVADQQHFCGNIEHAQSINNMLGIIKQ